MTSNVKPINSSTNLKNKISEHSSVKKELPANEKSVFIQEKEITEIHYKDKSQLPEILGTGSTISLFTGGATIFGSMLAKDAIKNPTLQTLFKNLPVVGKAMAIAGAIGLAVAFLANDNGPQTIKTEIIRTKKPDESE